MPLLSDIRNALSTSIANVGRKYKLPELGISEKVRADTPPTSSGGEGGGGSWGSSSSPTKSTPSYTPSSSGGSSSSSSSSGGDNIDDRSGDAEDAADAERKAMLKAIENEYNNIMGQLGVQESSLNAQLPITEGQITQSYGESVPTLQAEQGQKLADLQTQQTTGEQQSKGVMGQARQIYNELLSGANQFGGSAAGAYGELLGRSTAQTMGEARNNLATLITNVKGEIGRVNQFYSQKLGDLEKNKNLAIEQARKDFRDEVAKINALRNEAAGVKAQQNLAAMATFKQNIFQIRQAADVAKNALDLFNQEKSAALQASAQDAVKKYQLTIAQATDIAKGVGVNQVTGQSTLNLPALYGSVGKSPDEWSEDIWLNQEGIGTTTETEKKWYEN